MSPVAFSCSLSNLTSFSGTHMREPGKRSATFVYTLIITFVARQAGILIREVGQFRSDIGHPDWPCIICGGNDQFHRLSIRFVLIYGVLQTSTLHLMTLRTRWSLGIHYCPLKKSPYRHLGWFIFQLIPMFLSKLPWGRQKAVMKALQPTPTK